jgi:hypothetical protein
LKSKIFRDYSPLRLRLRELEGRTYAQLQLAKGSPERQWHLKYVEIFQAEVQQLQAQLQNHGMILHDESAVPQATTRV